MTEVALRSNDETEDVANDLEGAVMVVEGGLAARLKTAVEDSDSHASDVTADDFFTGLLAGLARRGVTSVSLRGEAFYRGVEEAFKSLAAVADRQGLDLRFSVTLDKAYGDSPVVRRAISSAVQGNLISLDNPEYQDMTLTIGRPEAALFLSRLAGDSGLYDDVASTFLATYPFVVFKRPS